MNKFEYPEDIMLQKKYNSDYPYKKMIDSLSLNDFFSTFDFYSNPFWSDTPYVEKDNYLYVDLISAGEEKIVNEGYFNYRINENGFRSKSFKEFNNAKTNIISGITSSNIKSVSGTATTTSISSQQTVTSSQYGATNG